MKNKTLVVVLLLFVVAVFVWIGYVLFFPKAHRSNASRFTPPTFQIESVLAKKVAMDYIRPVRITRDPFSPLIVKLDRNDLINLLKAPLSNANMNKRLVYISGVKSHDADMVTLSLAGKSVTFDFDSGKTRFSFDGKEYVVVYFNPTLEGAVIMNLSNGKLSIVSSRGMITE